MSCPKQEAFRPQPQTSRRPRHPTMSAIPTANATGTHCHHGSRMGCPGLAPICPSQPKHHQAGLETRVCSGTKNGTENFGAPGLCPAPGPVHSVTRSPWQHRVRTAVCSAGEGTAAKRDQSPRITVRVRPRAAAPPAGVTVTGQRHRRAGRSRRTVPACPPARCPEASRSVTYSHAGRSRLRTLKSFQRIKEPAPGSHDYHATNPLLPQAAPGRHCRHRTSAELRLPQPLQPLAGLSGAAPGWGALGDKTLRIPSLQRKCNRERLGERAAGVRRGPRGGHVPWPRGAPGRGTAPRCPSESQSCRPPLGPRLCQPRAGASPSAAPVAPLPTWRREASIGGAPAEAQPRLSAPHRRGRAGTAPGPAPRWLRLAGRGQRGAAGPPAPLRPAPPARECGCCGSGGAVPVPERSGEG